ncbi:TonB-dependent receptor domain-containing protein, partial [Erythrobacter donghaensis]|uniref:TonB-dependent receptor domain-containing protein n=1 Tax=Erythrobacter donghaensis TaxID=267135 RepID=UPI000ACD25F0
SGGGISHEFNFGGSMNWLVNRNAFQFFNISVQRNNLYAPVEVTPSTQVTFVGGNLDDPFPISRTRLVSAFFSDTIGFWDDRILFTAGLRLQVINAKSYSNATGALVSEYDEDKVTPVFGLVIKPTENLSLYANRIEGLVQGAVAPLTGA